MEYNGVRMRILAGSAETDGAFSVMTVVLPPYSGGRESQCHEVRIEACYVAEGIVALTRGDETVVLSTGDMELLRSGEAHTWWNPAALPARLLLIYAPGGTVAWDTS